jgi:hypothetical protein
MTKYDMIGRSAPEESETPPRPPFAKAPEVARQDSAGHKWSGVTRFKEQFGGEAVEILGSFDYINKPSAYKLFKMIERIRRK